MCNHFTFTLMSFGFVLINMNAKFNKKQNCPKKNKYLQNGNYMREGRTFFTLNISRCKEMLFRTLELLLMLLLLNSYACLWLVFPAGFTQSVAFSTQAKALPSLGIAALFVTMLSKQIKPCLLNILLIS